MDGAFTSTRQRISLDLQALASFKKELADGWNAHAFSIIVTGQNMIRLCRNSGQIRTHP